MEEGEELVIMWCSLSARSKLAMYKLKMHKSVSGTPYSTVGTSDGTSQLRSNGIEYEIMWNTIGIIMVAD